MLFLLYIVCLEYCAVCFLCILFIKPAWQSGYVMHYIIINVILFTKRDANVTVCGGYRSGQIAQAMKWEEAANGTALYSCECGLSKIVKYKSVLIKIHLSCNAFYTNYV